MTERRELEPLEHEHEFETLERLDKNTALQFCTICDFERVIEVEIEVEKHV